MKIEIVLYSSWCKQLTKLCSSVLCIYKYLSQRQLFFTPLSGDRKCYKKWNLVKRYLLNSSETQLCFEYLLWDLKSSSKSVYVFHSWLQFCWSKNERVWSSLLMQRIYFLDYSGNLLPSESSFRLLLLSALFLEYAWWIIHRSIACIN